MHTPQKEPPQSARRSSKHHKSHNFNDTQRSVQSDNDAYQAEPQEGDQTPSRKNRKPRKKSNAKRNGVQSDVGEMADPMVPRPSSHADRTRATPVKNIKSDAYAGPTFHQSPAPSALPIPPFFSRSMPNNAAISTIAESADGSADSKAEADKAGANRKELTEIERLLKAAEDARYSQNTPNGASPARFLSPPFGSPAGRSPAPRDGEGADFPFELEDGPSVYSTPLTQRFAAERDAKTATSPGVAMSEEERRAKTAALKKALLNDANQGLPGPVGNDYNNPFNARNVQPRADFPPRHTSNPATPTYQNGYVNNQNQYFQYQPPTPHRNNPASYNPRPTSSSLRNVYDPNPAPLSPPQTEPTERTMNARTTGSARPLNFGAIYGQPSRPSSEGNPVNHNSKPSLEQGLDDLRKALNMGTFFKQA